MEYVVQPFVFCNVGVLLAAENVVNILKDMSKQVTTPEEIAQVPKHCIMGNSFKY